MLKLFVWTADLDDEPGLIEAGLSQIVLLPVEFSDDLEGDGWLEVEICPN